MNAEVAATQFIKLKETHEQLVSTIEGDDLDNLSQAIKSRGAALEKLLPNITFLSEKDAKDASLFLRQLLEEDEKTIGKLEETKLKDKALLLQMSASSKASDAYKSNQ